MFFVSQFNRVVKWVRERHERELLYQQQVLDVLGERELRRSQIMRELQRRYRPAMWPSTLTIVLAQLEEDRRITSRWSWTPFNDGRPRPRLYSRTGRT